MKPFKSYSGTIVPLVIDNTDTDQIIPKQFLQAVTRSDFGKHLFFNWRYHDDRGEQENLGFPLNHERYRQASILLGGNNFGCGSSREHAVWAIQDFGFKVIIAPSFADIFYQNAMNNGLLPIALDFEIVDEIATQSLDGVLNANIDLVNRQVAIASNKYFFKINDTHRQMLLKGTDAIEQTLVSLDHIRCYEQQAPSWLS